MCWINWFINSTINKQESIDLIKKMNQILKHRGPDDDGFFVDEIEDQIVWFGHVRLSILDLTVAGHQPMLYRNWEWRIENWESDLSIVFNWEIYNFQSIKSELETKWYKFSTKCDTEVILASYAEWWKDCVKHFNWMFAFVIFDKKQNILFGTRDRLWKKPLKYYWDWTDFIFSSELKSILQHPIKREVDIEAIDQYLTLQYVPTPKTWFKNIYKLPHASYFVFDISKKSLEINKYWDLDYSNKLNLSQDQYIEEIEKRLDESVKLRMISDVEVWAFLSGWVDSSAIVAFASKYKDKLKTFTIKFNEKEFDESEYAKVVAKKYNTDHHEFLVEPDDMISLIDKIVYQYEEPYADSSQLPTFILSQKTSEFVKVALNGDWWDENFAWYDKYVTHLKALYFKYLPFKKIIGKFFKDLSELKNNLFYYKLFLFLKTYEKSLWQRHLNYTNYFDTFSKEKLYKEEIKYSLNIDQYRYFWDIIDWKRFDYLDEILYLDFNTYVPDDLMVKVDIATMAHWLESRSPLLDYNFVEFVAKIPYKEKIDSKWRKILFKRMLEKYLDKDILYRRKKGFWVPIDDWFRWQLKGYLRGILLDNDWLVLQLFKYEKIIELLEKQDKWMDNAKKLWVLMNLNLWYNKYFR